MYISLSSKNAIQKFPQKTCLWTFLQIPKKSVFLGKICQGIFYTSTRHIFEISAKFWIFDTPYDLFKKKKCLTLIRGWGIVPLLEDKRWNSEETDQNFEDSFV